MFEFTNISIPLIFLMAGILFVLQCLAFAATFFALRKFSRHNTQLSKELSGLVRRIEALTATRREQILKHYDKLLSKLSIRIPPTIAVHLGHTIFEAESRILKRLAELEPVLQRDDVNRKKMEDLIRVMENLEQALVSLTAEAVKNVMLESRADLLNEEKFLEEHLAA